MHSTNTTVVKAVVSMPKVLTAGIAVLASTLALTACVSAKASETVSDQVNPAPGDMVAVEALEDIEGIDEQFQVVEEDGHQNMMDSDNVLVSAYIDFDAFELTSRSQEHGPLRSSIKLTEGVPEGISLYSAAVWDPSVPVIAYNTTLWNDHISVASVDAYEGFAALDKAADRIVSVFEEEGAVFVTFEVPVEEVSPVGGDS